MSNKEVRVQAGEPEKIDQSITGPKGNCFSACIAMLLGLPLAEVPNFCDAPGFDEDPGPAFMKAAHEWLAARGWGHITIESRGVMFRRSFSKGYVMAAGMTSRGMLHSVIYKDGRLWHDPHPSHEGIQEVLEVDLLFPLNPASCQTQLQVGGEGLPDHLRGDGPCGDCGTLDNIVWFIASPIWNKVVREGTETDAILCIPCFVKRAHAKGIDPPAWEIVPESRENPGPREDRATSGASLPGPAERALHEMTAYKTTLEGRLAKIRSMAVQAGVRGCGVAADHIMDIVEASPEGGV